MGLQPPSTQRVPRRAILPCGPLDQQAQQALDADGELLREAPAHPPLKLLDQMRGIVPHALRVDDDAASLLGGGARELQHLDYVCDGDLGDDVRDLRARVDEAARVGVDLGLRQGLRDGRAQREDVAVRVVVGGVGRARGRELDGEAAVGLDVARGAGAVGVVHGAREGEALAAGREVQRNAGRLQPGRVPPLPRRQAGRGEVRVVRRRRPPVVRVVQEDAEVARVARDARVREERVDGFGARFGGAGAVGPRRGALATGVGGGGGDGGGGVAHRRGRGGAARERGEGI